MSSATTCDRCGQVFHYPYNEGWSILMLPGQINSLDLCGKCTRDLREKFLRDGTKSEEVLQRENLTSKLK